MVVFTDDIPDDPKLIDWIKDQKMFHVASAPLNGGHVNVSPKGLSCFKLVSRKACWYLDLTGSGNETISHMYEPGNGRITILFQAFEGPPQIARLYGKGRVYEKGTPEFEKFFDPANDDGELDFPTPEMIPGARAVVWIDITRVGTSCGFAVPIMKFVRHRNEHTKLSLHLEKQDMEVEDPYTLHWEKGIKSYWVKLNTWSIDGLPGLKHVMSRVTPQAIKQSMEEHGIKQPAQLSRRVKGREATVLLIGVALGLLLMFAIQHGLQGGVLPLCIGDRCLHL